MPLKKRGAGERDNNLLIAFFLRCSQRGQAVAIRKYCSQHERWAGMLEYCRCWHEREYQAYRTQTASSYLTAACPLNLVANAIYKYVVVTGKLNHASSYLNVNHEAGGLSRHLIRVCCWGRDGLVAVYTFRVRVVLCLSQCDGGHTTIFRRTCVRVFLYGALEVANSSLSYF